MKRYALIVLLPILSSCSVIEKRSVEEVRHEVAIPPTLLQPCIPDEPMDQEQYAKLSPFDREIELGIYTIHLYKVIATCNSKLHTIETIVNSFDGKQKSSKEEKP